MVSQVAHSHNNVRYVFNNSFNQCIHLGRRKGRCILDSVPIAGHSIIPDTHNVKEERLNLVLVLKGFSPQSVASKAETW